MYNPAAQRAIEIAERASNIASQILTDKLALQQQNAALSRQLAEKESVLECVKVEAELLMKAIVAGDPSAELMLRVEDIYRHVTKQPPGPEGEGA